MSSGFDKILGFIFDNVFYIVLIGFLVYFVMNYLKIKRGKNKIINRNEVERVNFIERMSQNKIGRPCFLYYDTSKLGFVTHYRSFQVESFAWKKLAVGKDKGKLVKKPTGNFKRIHQFVVRPILFFSIPNPFSKLKCYQIGDDSLIQTPIKYIIKKICYTDYIWGIYYDQDTIENTETIKNDNVMRTDLNVLAGIYFAKSQEQSTFNPEHAHQMALMQRQLQVELAKKQGKSETI